MPLQLEGFLLHQGYWNLTEQLLDNLDLNSVLKLRLASKSCNAWVLGLPKFWAKLLRRHQRMHAWIALNDCPQWEKLMRDTELSNDVDRIMRMIKIVATFKANSKCTTPLHQAAQEGNMAMVQFLQPMDHVAPKGISKGYTPLHLAAQYGRLKVLKYLLIFKRGDEAMNPRNKDGKTPFHLAAEAGHIHVVKFYMAILHELHPQTNVGFTPLHLALMVPEIRSFSNIYAEEPPYISANLLKNSRAVADLLVRTKGSVKKADFMNRCALYFAATTGHLSVVKYLTKRVKDKNPKDRSGLTAFHQAARNGHVEVIKHLLKYDPLNNLGNTLGAWSPLQFATYFSRLEAVKILLPFLNPDSPDWKSRYLLVNMAIQKGNKDVLLYIIRKIDKKALDTALNMAPTINVVANKAHRDEKREACKEFATFLMKLHNVLEEKIEVFETLRSAPA